MRINRVPNQRQLINASFNTKNMGSQSQMMHNSNTKWPTGNPTDNPKAPLESFVHTTTAQAIQKATRCTQNAACATSREATSNNTIAVTARTTFNDQETHLLRLRWVQSWRNGGLFSVLRESCSCWGEEIMSVMCVAEGPKKVFISSQTSNERRTEVRNGKWLCLFEVLYTSMHIIYLAWAEFFLAAAHFECFMPNTICSWQRHELHINKTQDRGIMARSLSTKIKDQGFRL